LYILFIRRNSKGPPELHSSLRTEEKEIRRYHISHMTPLGLPVVTGVVVRCLRGRALGGGVAPGHTAVDNEISAVDEAALVAGKEENRLSLLNGLAKATSGEVNFTTVALGLVVAEPILEEGSAGVVSSLKSLCVLEEERTSMALGTER
jgi:hypothetical protein